jgi:hypothetical protein
VWNKEKAAFLKAKGDLAWAERNTAAREFWDAKEGELDTLIVEAKASGPVKRKYRVVVPKEPTTAFGRLLASAVTQNFN